jgi:hypothetical protein
MFIKKSKPSAVSRVAEKSEGSEPAMPEYRGFKSNVFVSIKCT